MSSKTINKHRPRYESGHTVLLQSAILVKEFNKGKKIIKRKKDLKCRFSDFTVHSLRIVVLQSRSIYVVDYACIINVETILVLL